MIILFSIVNSANSGEPKIKDLTIVVSSCDKYSVLWQPFFDLLFKNWPSLKTYNEDVPILLVSNGKDFDDPRVAVIKSANELGWAANVNEALKQVRTKYVLYLQDDYFIYFLSEDKLIQVVRAMNLNELDRVLFIDSESDNRTVPNFAMLKYQSRDMYYINSLHSAVWRRNTFQELLIQERKTNKIWDFEHRKITDANKYVYYSGAKPIYYFNFMGSGKIYPPGYSWMVFQGYDMDFLDKYKIEDRGIGKEMEWLRRKMPVLASVVFYGYGAFTDLLINTKVFLKSYEDRFLSATN